MLLPLAWMPYQRVDRRIGWLLLRRHEQASKHTYLWIGRPRTWGKHDVRKNYCRGRC